jgi:signal transduction histidine kinase
LVSLGQQDNAPELIDAQRGITRPSIRWDTFRSEQRLFVAAPIAGDRSAVLGYVQLSVSMTPIIEERVHIFVTFAGISVVVLLVTILASILLARQIVVPVQHLTMTSEQIAAGKLDERVTPAGPSEVRRLGDAFNQMADRVQVMMAQQRAFVDNAAHELRSPLTGLRLRIEMLQTHSASNAALTQRYLSQMERELGYLQRVVDHLLALASAEQNEQAAPKTALDLSRVLYDLPDEMSPLAQHARVTLETDLPEHLPAVLANPDQMRIAIRNLLDNAVKYTRPGGAVNFSARATDERVEIVVRDTGAGIPADALPHVFDRFYRVDAAHSRSSATSVGGVGLGLSLVQAIIKAHGGMIRVTSQIGSGSAFTIELPLARNGAEMAGRDSRIR